MRRLRCSGAARGNVLGQPAIAWGAPGDIAVPADYDGNGTTDIAIYRPSTGSWYVRNQFTVTFGGGNLLPVPLDIDGDGRAELVMFDPSHGNWLIYSTILGQQLSPVSWGTAGDIPVAIALQLRKGVRGDKDGDGRADLMMFRPSDATWRTLYFPSGVSEIRTWGNPNDTPVAGDFIGTHSMQPAVFHNGSWSIDGGPAVSWGTAGDVPVVADFDGDGRSDIAVFRQGAWFVLWSSTNFTSFGVFTWGTAGDIPVVADFDGDGKANPAVFRQGTWYILTSSSGYNTASARVTAWGMAGDYPVAADYDGDGAADVAVFRPSNGSWYIVRSSDRATAVKPFGALGDVPVPADYDGDGRTDIAVYRPSTNTWLVADQFSVSFGAGSDVPVLAPNASVSASPLKK